VGACIFTLYFFIFYYLALPLHLPCPVSNLPFAAMGHRRRKLHKERVMFFFSFCCQGQEEKVTQGTGSVFFSFCCQG
jgi:hypothetical protein